MSYPSAGKTAIAIVGASAILPGSPDVAGFWRTVQLGRDLVTEVPATHWRTADYYDPDPAAPDKTYGRRGAFLGPVEFDPLAFGIPPNALPATDTAQLLALLAAERVLHDAMGHDMAALDRDRVSVIIGTAALELLATMSQRMQRPVWLKSLRESGVPEAKAQEVCDRIAEHYVPWQEATFPGLLSNVVAGRIANRFDFGGSNYTTDAACASSLAAVAAAVNELSCGQSDLVLTGGVDTLNDITMYMCFSKTPALSPQGDCRPFSDKADGTILGEGVAMFALKRLADAERDGDRVYAVIRGVGTSSDGRGAAIYAPLPRGQARALRRAYQAAGYGPETVELVEAHGTGTRAGDAAEFAALDEVFSEGGRPDHQWCAIGSVKSQIGHTKSAAGAVGLLKAMLALHHKTLPPTIKVEQPNPELAIGTSPLYVNTRTRPWVRGSDHPRRASVSSFGFGGSNFHLTLEEYPGDAQSGARRHLLARTAPTELVLLSADGPAELLARARGLLTDDRPLSTVARDSQLGFRPSDDARLAVVAVDPDDLAAKLDQAISRIGERPGESMASPAGLYCETGGSDRRRIAFLFPGQGSQYVGMGADLAMHSPVAQAVWDRFADTPVDGRRLHQFVFPVPAFSEAARSAQQAALTATEWAQPALAAQSLAVLSVLRAAGVEPDAVAGHSFGEFAALHAAGVFDAHTLMRLARRRGELMRDASVTPGGLLAVTASLEHVTKVIGDQSGLWIANHNAPDQVVVAGTLEALATLADVLAADGVSAQRLATAAAFHSPLVADAAAPLRRVLSEFEVGAPGLPVYGNSAAAPYPVEPDAVRDIMAGQLAEPVRFAELIEAMYRDGVRTFIEVGADAKLTSLVGRVLGDRGHLALSLDRKGRNGVTSLQHGLARLALSGVSIDFAALWEPYSPPVEEPVRRGVPVEILGANFGKRYPPADGVDYPGPNPDFQTSLVDGPGGGNPNADLLSSIAAQAAEAHSAYQQSMNESHLAFLRLAELSITGHNDGAVAVPQAPPVPQAPLPPPSVSAQPIFPVPSASVSDPLPAVEVPQDDAVPDAESLVLSVIAEKTGYPAEILGLEMELEADLGIDSIKRVEILSALGKRMPSASEMDMSEFSSMRSLRQIVAKLSDGGSGGEAHAVVDTTSTTSPANDQEAQVVRRVVRAVPAAAPGRPLPGLADGTLVVTDDGSGVAACVVEKLASAGIRAVRAAEVPTDARGVLFLGGLGSADSAQKALGVQRAAWRTARSIGAKCGETGGVFVTVQDTGGDFGLSGRSGERAWLGGIAALARTAAREWPRSVVKAIDCERGGQDPDAVAEAIVGELLTGGSATDVGLPSDGSRHMLVDVELPHLQSAASPRLGPDSVLVVTGGARGVTAAAVRALAQAHRPRLVLLGRTRIEDEPPYLEGITGRADLTRAVSEESRRSAGEQLKPSEVSAIVSRILACREIRATLDGLAHAGSPVRYLPVDIRDAEAVNAALADVRRDWGPVTGIIHGAGVLADKRIADKTDEQFDRVFDTKVEGLRMLLSATVDDPIDLLCVFSSVAARYGNAGQCDYAMANETLNHVISAESARRGGIAVRALNWGPWEGGMVDSLLAERFRERGVALIGRNAGAEAFVAEIECAGSDEARVVITAESPPNRAITVNSRTHPYLADHEIAGMPVLPLALVLEWFTAAAARPGAATGLRDVQVLHRVGLDRFNGDGHRLTVTVTETLQLVGDDGTRHFQATADFDEAGADDWTKPLGLESYNGPVYDGDVLFHGPRFQAIESLRGVSGAGAAATVLGARALGWPGAAWSTDPAAVDGGLQLAVLWANRVLGGASLPMSVSGFRVHRAGLLDGPAQCLVRGRTVRRDVAECDVALVVDRAVHVELLGVSLVRRPLSRLTRGGGTQDAT